MTERIIESADDRALREARLRLAENLGGRWLVYKEVSEPARMEPEHTEPFDRGVVAAEIHESEQRLVELGMRAAGPQVRQSPYFVK